MAEPENEGCDCTELCEMGPTCPGGMLAGLTGAGCWRTKAGCCTACGGIGADLSGPCWDCRGTGHPHPDPEKCRFTARDPDLKDWNG